MTATSAKTPLDLSSAINKQLYAADANGHPIHKLVRRTSGPICPICRHHLRPGIWYCGNCGSALPKPGLGGFGKPLPDPPPTKRCPHCAALIHALAWFCKECGKSIPDLDSDANGDQT